MFMRWATLAAALHAAPVLAQDVDPAAPDPKVELRLYTLDCGRLDFREMGQFSDTGEYEGQSGWLAVPCFLIRHGEEWLLWDAGLGDEIAEHPNGVLKQGFRFSVTRTLESQLAELGLEPGDVARVALSHLHADHSGNIGLFPDATFLVQQAELDWALAEPTPGGVEAALVAPLREVEVDVLVGDRDVFDDGSVQILSAPGHTPGHQFLLVRPPETGALLITADLYHTRWNFRNRLVPDGNTSRADTLASMDRLDGLIENSGARVIVSHAPEDFAAMPAFPAYLD